MKCKQSIPDVVSDSIEMRKGFSSSVKNSRRPLAPRRTNTQPVLRHHSERDVASATIRPFTMPLLSEYPGKRDTIVTIEEGPESSTQHAVVEIVNSDEIKEVSEKIENEEFIVYDDVYCLAKGTTISTILCILIIIFLFYKFWGAWKSDDDY